MKVVKMMSQGDMDLSDMLIEDDSFYGGIFIAPEHLDAWRNEFNTERKAEDSLVEEMAELIQAINKQRRNNTKKSQDAIREEMAHVLISLKGLCRYKMITPGEIEKEIQAKWPDAYEPSDTKQKQDEKWSAMTEALKEKGVEVIYMGEQDGKPIIDIKIPGWDDDKKWVNTFAKDCADFRADKFRLERERDELKEQCDILRKDGVLKGQQYLKLKEDLNALKKEYGRVLGEFALCRKQAECDHKKLEAYCDGFVHVSSGIDGIISADEITNGTVPKCSSCAYYVSGSRRADVWCHKPVSKEGPGTVRRLSAEEAEGPACVDFKARKEPECKDCKYHNTAFWRVSTDGEGMATCKSPKTKYGFCQNNCNGEKACPEFEAKE